MIFFRTLFKYEEGVKVWKLSGIFISEVSCSNPSAVGYELPTQQALLKIFAYLFVESMHKLRALSKNFSSLLFFWQG